MKKEQEIVNSMIEILFDPTCDVATQDDAVIYLGKFDNDRALDALIRAAQSPDTDDWLVIDRCGESIARIWDVRSTFDLEAYLKMREQAKVEIYGYFVNTRPDLIEKYKIPKP